MLPPFIIEQIRQREEQDRLRSHRQPRLELPVDIRQPAPAPKGEEEETERGVVILDLG